MQKMVLMCYIYLLELLPLDPGVFENQYTTLLHHPVTCIGSPYFSSAQELEKFPRKLT